jgi:hypothetical protein
MAEASSTDRRTLTFDTIDDVMEDINRIQAAQESGTLAVCGQWTAGEILTHLSAWIEYGYEGYPMEPAPWIVRQGMKLFLMRILKNGMEPGVKIPGVEGGTTGQIKVATETACQRYLVALNRLASSEPVKYPSPAFGDLSQEKRVKLNLRHAELHLSFITFTQ